MLEIRPLFRSEINLLKDLPPKEWDMNLPNIVSFHYGYPYFYPIVAIINNKIVGFGNGTLNNKVGWIGNILVIPEYRRQGIGHQLTCHLVEYFRGKGCTSQLLVASEMGKNIYSKIGFKTSSEYHVYKLGTENKKYLQTSKLRKVKEEDYSKLKGLDTEVTGEERFHLVERFFATGIVYWCKESKEIQGVYLPDLDSGLILAVYPEAGLELLKHRISQGRTSVTIPSENIKAANFLQKEGFQLQLILPRMVIGDEVNWKQKFIFNRGTGYFG